MSVNKNTAIIDYLLQCPNIVNSPLYFNFIEVKDGATQVLTMTDETATLRRYVDGSVRRRYMFNLLVFKSISEAAIPKPAEPMDEMSIENVEDISDVQALIDWVSEQNDLRNYPNFGESCIIENIESTTDTPRLMGVNTELNPPLAMYSVSIQVEYIDESKVIWN